MDSETSKSTHADLTYLHSILPESYDAKITNFNQGENPNHFNCIIRLPIFKKDDAIKWLKEFEEKSLTTWKVDRTYPEYTSKVIFKKEFHCQHNTKPRSGSTSHEKHTGCQSKLTITIQQLMKRSKDVHNKLHPCQVNLRFIHNHDITTSAALKHRSPTEAVKILFEDLFTQEMPIDDQEFEQPIPQVISNDHESQVDSISCQKELELVFQDMSKRLSENPSVYTEPINKFIELYQKCKTESAMVSALHTFGKYSGMPLIKKGKNLQGGKVIGVQPTAVARRKIKIGGRFINKSGRPPKTSYTNEHGYGKRKLDKTNFPQIQVKKAKPHSITASLENNACEK